MHGILAMMRCAILALIMALFSACGSSGDSPMAVHEDLGEFRRIWSWGQDKKEREKALEQLRTAEGINEAERAIRIYEIKLQDYAVTLDHYTQIVLDKFLDRNTGYGAEIAEAGQLLIMNSATRKRFTVNLAGEQQKSADPSAIIDSLIARARGEIGNPPPVQPVDPLRTAGVRDKPFLAPYRQAGQFLKQAGEANRQGRREEAISLTKKAIEIRAVYLGAKHPETVRILALYDSLRGIVAQPTPRTVTPADLADEELRLAGEKWNSGHLEASIEHAEKALQLRRMQLGENHASVQEVKAMIAAAEAHLNP